MKSPNEFRLVAAVVIPVRLPVVVADQEPPLYLRMTKLPVVAPLLTSVASKVKVTPKVPTASPPPGVSVQYRVTSWLGLIPEPLICGWFPAEAVTTAASVPAAVTFRPVSATGR